jgi:hypothetical protein
MVDSFHLSDGFLNRGHGPCLIITILARSPQNSIQRNVKKSRAIFYITFTLKSGGCDIMFDIGWAKKRRNTIVAGSHSHYFVILTMFCIMLLRKLWERHLAAINKDANGVK